MDIYSYLNSKDIADYCRGKEIGFEFSLMEQAYIIVNCNHISLTEKHRALAAVCSKINPVWHIANLLKQFIHAQQNAICQLESLQRNNRSQAVHSDVKYYLEADCKYLTRNIPRYDFSSFQGAYEKLISISKCHSGCFGTIIVDLSGYHKWIRIEFGENLEIISAYNYRAYELYYQLFDLESYTIMKKLHLPFRKGDLIVAPFSGFDGKGYNPYIIRWIEYNSEDETVAFVYGIDDDGYLFNDCLYLSLDTEYYRGENTPRIKQLIELSKPVMEPLETYPIDTILDIMKDERYKYVIDWNYDEA